MQTLQTGNTFCTFFSLIRSWSTKSSLWWRISWRRLWSCWVWITQHALRERWRMRRIRAVSERGRWRSHWPSWGTWTRLTSLTHYWPVRHQGHVIIHHINIKSLNDQDNVILIIIITELLGFLIDQLCVSL